MSFKSEKEKKALFVDLTNFYTRFIKSDLDTSENLRTYFTDWFDFSVLSKFLTGGTSDVWIFYSGSKLGPREARIDDLFLKNFIARINKQKGVTAYDVNISGEQRESYKLMCNECGAEADTIWKSEKGIDSSLIVHLFDTMESWDKAYLLSGDADFVPAVKSLRRHGKIVNGAGFTSNASSALIRECFDYINLEEFFLQNLAIYKLFKETGLISGLCKETILKPLEDKNALIMDREFNVSISLENNFHENNISLRISSTIIDFEKAKAKFKGLPLIQKFYKDQYEVLFDGYLFDYIKVNLKLIAQELQLVKEISDESYDHEYHNYYASFVWNMKAKIYERVPK